MICLAQNKIDIRTLWFQVEPCADVIVSAEALVNFGPRRRLGVGGVVL